MESPSERITEHAAAKPEATPTCPPALLHRGKRATVNQAVSRLACGGRLIRICHGGYMRHGEMLRTEDEPFDAMMERCVTIDVRAHAPWVV